MIFAAIINQITQIHKYIKLFSIQNSEQYKQHSVVQSWSVKVHFYRP